MVTGGFSGGLLIANAIILIKICNCYPESNLSLLKKYVDDCSVKFIMT